MAEEIVHSKTPAVTILDLPSLPLEKIFSYLRPPDVVNCALTCQAFLSLSRDPSLWKALYPTQWAYGFWSNYILDGFELACYRRSECPLVVTNRTFQVDHGLKINSKWDLFEHNLLTRMLEQLVPRIGVAVRELYLNCSNVLNDHLLSVALIHCPNLVTLDIKETNITEKAFTGLSDYNACRQLQNLDLSDCAAIEDTTITRLASCWTSDEDDVTHTNSRIENTISVIEVDGRDYEFRKGSGLQWNLNDKTIVGLIRDQLLQSGVATRTIELPNVKISKKCKVAGVRSLNLSGCYKLTDETLFTLMTVQPLVKTLSILDLSGCFNMSGGAISDFVKVCPKLKPENLYYCDHIQLGPYQFEANGCSNLQKNGCCVVPEF